MARRGKCLIAVQRGDESLQYVSAMLVRGKSATWSATDSFSSPGLRPDFAVIDLVRFLGRWPASGSSIEAVHSLLDRLAAHRHRRAIRKPVLHSTPGSLLT